MTVSSNTSRWSYTGNGTNDTFAYTTEIFTNTDLDVYVAGTLKTITTHYTVSGVGNAAGGNVVFTAGNIPANGASVVIVKDVPYTQASSLPLGGSFPSTTVENALDKLTILDQQIYKRVTGRVLRQPDADATDLSELAVAATRASTILGFDSNGQVTYYTSANATTGNANINALSGLTSAADKVPYFTDTSGGMAVADFTSFGRSLVDDANAAAARTTLGLAIGADVQAYDANLNSLSGLTPAADKVPYFTDTSGGMAVADFTSFGRSLVDDANAAAARTTLGLAIGTNVQAYDADLTTLGAGGASARTFLGLGTGDSPSFSTLTLSGGQIAFPATQNASADANTLDDYEEGTWTPALTFATPGDLSVTYSTQQGRYTKIGREVKLTFALVTSAFTHTTASGNSVITGSPFTAAASPVDLGTFGWRGITKANYTQVNIATNASSANLSPIAYGNGQINTNITAADMPTGGTVNFRGTLWFTV